MKKGPITFIFSIFPLKKDPKKDPGGKVQKIAAINMILMYKGGRRHTNFNLISSDRNS